MILIEGIMRLASLSIGGESNDGSWAGLGTIKRLKDWAGLMHTVQVCLFLSNPVEVSLFRIEDLVVDAGGCRWMQANVTR